MAEPSVADVDLERGDEPQADVNLGDKSLEKDKPLPEPKDSSDQVVSAVDEAAIDAGPVLSASRETQLQELQKELQDFLGQHVGKVMQLQKTLMDQMRPRPPFAHAMTVSDRDTAGDAVSAGRASTGNFAVFSHMDLGGTRTGPFDMHTYALDQFLAVHLENIQVLQETLNKGHPSAPAPLSTIAETSHDPGGHYNAQMQQFGILAVSSALLGIFILAFLSLSNWLIGPERNRIPFSVGLFFAYFCLALLLLSIALALWGIMSASWRRMRGMPESALQSHFHLHLGRQIQFCVGVAIFLPIILLSFYSFVSIAFPIVFLIMLLTISLLVVGCVFYRVPITFENVSTLILGTRHMERPSRSQKRPVPRSRRSFY
ncbi:hypothetical protein FA15DRAFT_359734 [Coprinopsis marcescibilis]|uniref:Transmembrane protein n=1 Tax=Coprinopsis marcescibilis TaxID=230819 RepID=A0A5C3KY37_COPMA|nr:hypothetical protein FA15DRAFT_359734 [Coprinopsis marcescibilis]